MLFPTKLSCSFTQKLNGKKFKNLPSHIQEEEYWFLDQIPAISTPIAYKKYSAFKGGSRTANPINKTSLYHQRRGSLPVVSVLDSRQTYFQNGHLKNQQGGPNNMSSAQGVTTQTRISDVFNGLFRVKSIKNNLKRTKSAIKLDNRKRKPEEDSGAKKGSLPNPVPAHAIRNCRSHESLACSTSILGNGEQRFSQLGNSKNGDLSLDGGDSFPGLTIHTKVDLIQNEGRQNATNVGSTHKTVLRQPYAFQVSKNDKSARQAVDKDCSDSSENDMTPPPPQYSDYYSCHSPSERTKWVDSIRDTINQGAHTNRRRENCLQIWILEAKGVPAKKRYFCEVYLDRNLNARTASKMKAELCFWGETFDFKGLPDVQMLSVHFYRDSNEKKKKREKPQFIGNVTIPIDVIRGNQFYEKWYPVNGPTSTSSTSKSTRQEKPAIRIKARYQTFNILPIHLYKDFLNILTEDYMSVCQYLEFQVSVKTKEDVAASLVYIFEHFGMAEEFLTSIVEMEVNKLENESLTFRGNSLATKSIEAYMKYIALPYLRKTLSDFITVILDSNDDCEVDPTKVSGKSTLYRNQQNLTMYCEMAWSKIINSYSYFPLPLRKVFQSIRKRLESSCHKPEISDNVISASIFLRFLCPAILSPSLFGLVQEYPQERAARNLTLIAKTIQTLANSNKFGGKEGYMNFMNHFVEREWINMKCFLRKISSLDVNSLSAGSLPPNFRRAELSNGPVSAYESLSRKSLVLNPALFLAEPSGPYFKSHENAGFSPFSGSFYEGDEGRPCNRIGENITGALGWDRCSIDLGKELSLAHSRLNETLDKVQPLPLPDDQFYTIHTKLKLVLDALEEALGNDKPCKNNYARFTDTDYDVNGSGSPIVQFQTNAMRRSLRFQSNRQFSEPANFASPKTSAAPYLDAPLSHIALPGESQFVTPTQRRPFSPLPLTPREGGRLGSAQTPDLKRDCHNYLCHNGVGSGVVGGDGIFMNPRIHPPGNYEPTTNAFDESQAGGIQAPPGCHPLSHLSSPKVPVKNGTEASSVYINLASDRSFHINRRNTDLGSIDSLSLRANRNKFYQPASYDKCLLPPAFPSASAGISPMFSPSTHKSKGCDDVNQMTPSQAVDSPASYASSPFTSCLSRLASTKVNRELDAMVASDDQAKPDPEYRSAECEAAADLANYFKSSTNHHHTGSQLSLGMASSGYHTLNTKQHSRLNALQRANTTASDCAEPKNGPDPCPTPLVKEAVDLSANNNDSSPAKHFSSASSPYSSANEEENNSLNSSGASYPDINGDHNGGAGLCLPTANFDASKVQDSIIGNCAGFKVNNKLLENNGTGGDCKATAGTQDCQITAKGSTYYHHAKQEATKQALPWIPLIQQNGATEQAKESLERSQPPYYRSQGKFFKNPASLVIDPILPKYQSSRNIHKKSNGKPRPPYGSSINPKERIDAHDDEFIGVYNKKIVSQNVASHNILNGPYDESFHQSPCLQEVEEKFAKLALASNSAMQNHNQTNLKTPFEYEVEIDCLRKQMRSLQVKLVESEERLSKQNDPLTNANGGPLSSQNEMTIDEYKKEKDQQMGLILNRLMVLERELRLEHDDIHSTVKDKQLIIEAQERRIRELDEANEKLLKTLGRINGLYISKDNWAQPNGKCHDNNNNVSSEDDKINEDSSTAKMNGEVARTLNGAAVRLSSAHHLNRVGPPNKTIMKLVNPSDIRNLNSYDYATQHSATDKKRRESGELVPQLHNLFLTNPQKSSNC